MYRCCLNFLLPCLAIVMFVSCQEQVNREDEVVEVEKGSTDIGLIHNDGLAYILNKVKGAKMKTRSGESFCYEEAISIAEEASISFVSNPEMGFCDSEIQSALIALDKVKEIEIKDGLTSTVSTSCQLTPVQLLYFKNLDSILSNTTDVAKAIRDINELEKAAEKGGLSQNDLYIVRIGLSVAKNSLQYWNCNGAIWNEELGSQPVNTRSWFTNTLTDMGISDASGAIVGAFVGGPAGAVAGGCYASAAKGAEEVIKRRIEEFSK